MATQNFKRNLLLNLYREEKKNISLVCFFLPLKGDKNVWHLQAISPIWRPLAFLPVTLSLILWPPDAKSWLIWRPWCWERLKSGEEGDNRGRDVCMASPTQRTWVWVSSGSWWWIGRPGMLRSMGSWRHDWVTGLNWAEQKIPNSQINLETEEQSWKH